MDDLTRFEERFATRVRDFALTGVRPVDPSAVVEAVVRDHRSRVVGTLSTGWRLHLERSPRARLLLVAAMLLVAVGAAAAVGARLVSRPTPIDQGPTEPTSRVYRGTVVQVGALTLPRDEPALARLPGGEVLVVGSGPPGAVAEIFDPRTHLVRPAGPGAVAALSRLVPLADGRILILGWEYGQTAETGRSVAQVYDPATDTFTGAGTLTQPGIELAAVRLADGGVLVSGGSTEDGVPVATAQRFDPASGTFAPTGKMLVARSGHHMTLLADGRVLVVGGSTRLPQAEIYEPSTGTFRPAGARIETKAYRGSTTARVAPIRLRDGRVLVFGVPDGRACGEDDYAPISAESFDPATETFSAAPPIPHGISTATLMDDGLVLLTGSWSTHACSPVGTFADDWIGIYDPTSGQLRMSLDPISGVSTLPGDTDRDYGATARLDDGRILLVATPDPLLDEPLPSALDIFE